MNWDGKHRCWRRPEYTEAFKARLKNRENRLRNRSKQ